MTPYPVLQSIELANYNDNKDAHYSISHSEQDPCLRVGVLSKHIIITYENKRKHFHDILKKYICMWVRGQLSWHNYI